MRSAIAFKLLPIALVLLATPASFADDDVAANRQRLDSMASETVAELFERSPQARELYSSAHGYAVFSNLKISLIITGGGGHGVAVDRQTEARTYMHMGTAGLNLGLGGQKYKVVFLFETEKSFREFADAGWEAEASANAAAGTKGVNAAAGFRNGVAIYQITDKGLIAQADISGTRYWRSKKLN